MATPLSGVSIYLQSHLPGPGARARVLSIDDPAENSDAGRDGWKSTLCSRRLRLRLRRRRFLSLEASILDDPALQL